MPRQSDEQLRVWANEIGGRLRAEGWASAYLVYHGSPGSEGPSTAHAENTENLHVLELKDVEVDDLNRLREFLLEQGLADVTVKQASAGGSHVASAEVR
jgi:hypothetical protein